MSFARPAVLALLLATTTVGCGSRSSSGGGSADTQAPASSPAVLAPMLAPGVRQLLVSLPSLASQGRSEEDQQRLLLEAVRAHLDAFERNEGVVSLGATVVISGGTRVACGSAQNAIGCTSGGQISVAAGYADIVPALYHELAHLNFAPGDVNHEDPRWATWNARCASVNEALLAGR